MHVSLAHGKRWRSLLDLNLSVKVERAETATMQEKLIPKASCIATTTLAIQLFILALHRNRGQSAEAVKFAYDIVLTEKGTSEGKT